MAHHQKQQADAARRGSAVQSLLKMFSLSNAPTVPTGDDEVVGEADEPPDDQITDLPPVLRRDSSYPKAISKPQNTRRQSLLTKAIWEESHPDSSLIHPATRGLSTASSRSAASTVSTADLTSDGGLTSPARSMTPSPPLPADVMTGLHAAKNPPSKVIIAPITNDDKATVADVAEAAVEKTLGRKRCIMFACSGKTSESIAKPTPPAEPPKRKCALTFACPSRENKSTTSVKTPEARSQRKPSPAPVSKRHLSVDLPRDDNAGAEAQQDDSTPKSPAAPQAFHEFCSSLDETDAWVHDTPSHKEKLTVRDCLKKEIAIRKTCTEAEDEAEDEEREQEELNQELDEEEAQQDDFAPSDEDRGSDGGNESDDEGGFADSDDESDTGSDYHFWATAPSASTAATSAENVTLSHFSSRGRSRTSSLDSNNHSTSPHTSVVMHHLNKRKATKLARMRPGTPELPDSTDFVCGTLDEDRPLEAAYISCREQKKREKHVPIPQDIDPSFPTTDPEDNNEDDDDDDDEEESPTAGGPMWLKGQFDDFEQEGRGRPRPQAMRTPTPPAPRNDFPFPSSRRTTNRSFPPKRGLGRSPPPKKLFGHSPAHRPSPAPQTRLRSPPGSPNAIPGTGLTINRLAQRPLGYQGRERTTSLPRTPNPFFRNFKVGSPSISNIASGAVTPADEETPRFDLHVRGPVDIVMGLEKKRQKRKEKFWRQHCRKVAKEQAEKKTVPGRGAERMKELGLECAERNRGYGPGQTQLVISL